MFVEFESPKISSSQVMTWSSQVTRTVTASSSQCQVK